MRREVLFTKGILMCALRVVLCCVGCIIVQCLCYVLVGVGSFFWALLVLVGSWCV